jgi:hypothetical protein
MGWEYGIRTVFLTGQAIVKDSTFRPAREDEEQRRQQTRQRTTLIAAGATYANELLRQQHGLESWTRLDLEQKVKRARRPASGRILAMEYRVYSLLEASHATRQDRENPPNQLRGLIQQAPEMGAIYDEQPEIGRRHDRR